MKNFFATASVVALLMAGPRWLRILPRTRPSRG